MAMATKLGIWRAALMQIGANDIASTTDNSVETRACSVLYPAALQSVLSDADWGFARKVATLALLEDTYTGWDYAYKYPADCLRMRRIVETDGTSAGGNYNGSELNHWDVLLSDDGYSHVIVCNVSPCTARYTKNIDNEALFDPSFTDALIMNLSYRLCVPLKRSSNDANVYRGFYKDMIEQALLNSANEVCDTYSRPSKYRQDNG